MRKKVRKVLSVLLTVSMTASMFSGIAFAEGAGKLFGKDEPTPRLIISRYRSNYSDSDKYEFAEVTLASAANAAIATASEVTVTASPSDALNILEVDPDAKEDETGNVVLHYNPYKNNEFYDYRATMSNATEKIKVGVKTDKETYQSEVELVSNWFDYLDHNAEAHEDKIELGAYIYHGNTWNSSGTNYTIKVYDLQNKDQEITEKEGWFDNKQSEIIFNVGKIKKEDRKEQHVYLIELYGSDKKIYGYCYVLVYPLPSMVVDGEVIHTQSVEDYISKLGEKNPDKLTAIQTFEIMGGSMSSTDWRAIRRMTGLKSLTVGSDVQSTSSRLIPDSAFEGMKSLETVSINAEGNGKTAGPAAKSGTSYVQSIGDKAFKDCTNLKNVSIPGITIVGAQAFENCTSLSDLTAADVQTAAKEAFSGCTALTKAEFPALTGIYDGVFENCTGLEMIKLPNISWIYERAFKNCTSLDTMYLNDSAPWLWSWGGDTDVAGIFEGVPKPLKEYQWVDNNGEPVTGDYYRYALEDYREGYSSGGNHTAAYKVWKELLGFSDPEAANIWVSVNGTYTLSGESLNACIESYLAAHKEVKRTDITKLIASGEGIMTKEDWKTLESLPALTWLQIGYESSPCNLREQIPDGVRMPKQLENFFLLNENAIEIPDSMFEGCSKLLQARVDNVTKIGNRAFAGCSSLRYLTLPENPPELGSDVFSGISPRFCLNTVTGNLDKYMEAIEKSGRAEQWLYVLSTDGPTPSNPESSSSSSSVSQTGQWVLNDRGWWYDLGNGLWPSNQWSCLYYNGRYDWYYFDQEGYMVTGWYTDAEGKSYYFHPTADGRRGYMYTGWNLIDGAWYYFSTESGEKCGMLLKNTTTPDGYVVNEDGMWVR